MDRNPDAHCHASCVVCCYLVKNLGRTHNNNNQESQKSGTHLISQMAKLAFATIMIRQSRRKILLASLVAAWVVYVLVMNLLSFDAIVYRSISWPEHGEAESRWLQDSTDVVLGIYSFPSAVRTPHSTFEGLVRFAATLRRSGSSAVVVIFLPWIPDGLRDSLIASRVVLIKYDEGLAVQVGWYSFSSLRFTLYRRFLDRYPDRYSRVMTSDVSDVVFQADPFESAEDETRKLVGTVGGVADRIRFIAAALEETTITGDGVNGYWIKTCFGSAELNQMLGLQISCSGTTVGDAESMREYIISMDSHMRTGVFCAAQGIDQGVHNYLIYRDQRFLSRSTLHKNSEGPFLTVDKLRVMHFNKSTGVVLTPNSRRPYAVIHQINRCKEFVHTFKAANGMSDPWEATKTWGCRDLFKVPAPIVLPSSKP